MSEPKPEILEIPVYTECSVVNCHREAELLDLCSWHLADYRLHLYEETDAEGELLTNLRTIQVTGDNHIEPITKLDYFPMFRI